MAKIRIKGITNRWLINSFGVAFVIIIGVLVFSSYSVKQYYYSGIEQSISGRSNELANFYGNNTTSKEFLTSAVGYVENFPDKNMMEIMVLDSNGDVVITSSGFEIDDTKPIPDYEEAIASNNVYGKWTGKLSSGEDVLSVTRVIYNLSGANVGAIRYIVSLEPANRQIFLNISFIFLGVLSVLFMTILSGAYFIRSIIKPAKRLTETAHYIAQGDFNTKIEKEYDDEIGDLCDAVNNMASELGAAEKMKNDFISSVSHELRTPLTAIKGWAETMQLSGANPDPYTMEKGMSVIIKETERLSGIVEELLDFSRIQSGRIVLIMERMDILAELDEAVYMLNERAISEEKHIIFNEPETVSPIIGDKNRIKQVFLNIIDNALKYSHPGGIINVIATEENGNVVIVISDEGQGIAKEDLPRVKEKFFKANTTVRGSGIGLALCDEIVRLHNGSLIIDSEKDVGTTVTVVIPTAHNNQSGGKETQ